MHQSTTHLVIQNKSMAGYAQGGCEQLEEFSTRFGNGWNAEKLKLKCGEMPHFVEKPMVLEGNVNKMMNYVAFADLDLYRRGPVHDLAGSSSGVLPDAFCDSDGDLRPDSREQSQVKSRCVNRLNDYENVCWQSVV